MMPVLVEDYEDAFRHGFDFDNPVVRLSDGELVGLPRDVFAGMYVTAWARAEGCPVDFSGGLLGLWSKYQPSAALYEAFGRHVSQIVGVMLWAVPLLRDRGGRAFSASWPFLFGNSGVWSRH